MEAIPDWYSFMHLKPVKGHCISNLVSLLHAGLPRPAVEEWHLRLENLLPQMIDSYA